MATVATQTLSAPIQLDMNIASLAGTAGLLAGFESVQVTNAVNALDYLVNVDPILGNTSIAPTINQGIEIWVWGADTSLATIPWDALDGTAGAVTLTHKAAKFAMCLVASPTVTVATGNLTYPVKPFSIGNCFDGIVPDFWGLFLTHNHNGALAASNTALFSYQSLTYTST